MVVHVHHTYCVIMHVGSCCHGMSVAFSCVCELCVSVCLCSKRKTARAISTKGNRDTVHGKPSARVAVRLERQRMGEGWEWVRVIGLHVNMTVTFIC